MNYVSYKKIVNVSEVKQCGGPKDEMCNTLLKYIMAENDKGYKIQFIKVSKGVRIC
jgi:hypothetical protein